MQLTPRKRDSRLLARDSLLSRERLLARERDSSQQETRKRLLATLQLETPCKRLITRDSSRERLLTTRQAIMQHDPKLTMAGGTHHDAAELKCQWRRQRCGCVHDNHHSRKSQPQPHCHLGSEWFRDGTGTGTTKEEESMLSCQITKCSSIAVHQTGGRTSRGNSAQP